MIDEKCFIFNHISHTNNAHTLQVLSCTGKQGKTNCKLCVSDAKRIWDRTRGHCGFSTVPLCILNSGTLVMLQQLTNHLQFGIYQTS